MLFLFYPNGEKRNKKEQKNKYVLSLTSIPSRYQDLDKIIKSLNNQTFKFEKIFLHIPRKYKRNFKDYILDTDLLKSLEDKYNNLKINYIDNDYGPGTKLLGMFETKYNFENNFVVLLDDDNIYDNNILEIFDNQIENDLVGSFFTYKVEDITIGQGCDGFFIRGNTLKNFKNYYDIIKDLDEVFFHDDLFISYYFKINNIHIKKINKKFINNYQKIFQPTIYRSTKSYKKDALHKLNGNLERNKITKLIIDHLNELNENDKFK